MNLAKLKFSKVSFLIVAAIILGLLFYLYIYSNSKTEAFKKICREFTNGSNLVEFWPALKAAGADGFIISKDGKTPISIDQNNLEDVKQWNLFLEATSEAGDGKALAYASIWPRMIAECRVHYTGQLISKSEFTIWH